MSNRALRAAVYAAPLLLSLPVHAAAGLEPAWPEPPRQHRPWTAPGSSLPQALLKDTATLFAQGLADPRGCEYRVVRFAGGKDPRGKPFLAATHAWVIPNARTGRKFAVCWNGLVYPVHSVGSAADLRRDVLAAVEPIERAGKQPGYRWVFGANVDASSADPLRACLLLRVGEEQLACRMWAVSTEQLRLPEPSPYLDLAHAWLTRLHDRMIWAHQAGDDALALKDARFLVRAQAAVNAENERRGFPHYVHFGTSPADLLRDQELRRANRGAQLISIDDFDPDVRIAVLIGQLAEVSERQCGHPGSPDLSASAIVQALVREGDRALEPLLDCLVSDPRLTRSVTSSRGWNLHVLQVRDAAYAALTQILSTSRATSQPRRR